MNEVNFWTICGSIISGVRSAPRPSLVRLKHFVRTDSIKLCVALQLFFKFNFLVLQYLSDLAYQFLVFQVMTSPVVQGSTFFLAKAKQNTPNWHLFDSTLFLPWFTRSESRKDWRTGIRGTVIIQQVSGISIRSVISKLLTFSRDRRTS